MGIDAPSDPPSRLASEGERTNPTLILEIHATNLLVICSLSQTLPRRGSPNKVRVRPESHITSSMVSAVASALFRYLDKTVRYLDKTVRHLDTTCQIPGTDCQIPGQDRQIPVHDCQIPVHDCQIPVQVQWYSIRGGGMV